MTDFDGLVRRATGGSAEPYDYQRRLAEAGLPELLAVPTGSGKTMAAVLPWLYRRRFHHDEQVRRNTPRWLVFVLPMRVLVEQTYRVIGSWLDNLGLSDDVGCHVLMGGEPLGSPWRKCPESDLIVVGTLDMVLSRSLNRGYGQSRYSWPVDFGLFNAGCQFVFDEVQLMGPALATSRQLHGLRRKLGEAMPCQSMWMSATMPENQLATFDAPEIGGRVQLTSADRTGVLRTRLEATKMVRQLTIDNPRAYAREVAAALAQQHHPGTLTLAVVNTVDRAREIASQLTKAKPAAEVTLLHSRYRPNDRVARVARVLDAIDPVGPGRIVVSTQVVEAGVDISASVLFTEAAPWPSIVQRAGRCNRDGTADGAVMLWASPPQPAPYPAADLQASVASLENLDGQPVSPEELGAQRVSVTEVITAVLRRRDLLQLFDTQPDLGGNDIDVSKFIRDAEDLDLAVAWRTIAKEGPPATEPMPGRDERCPVPVRELRQVLAGDRVRAWRWDHLAARWRRCTATDVRPGMVVLLDVGSGCYSPGGGWDPRSTATVEPVMGTEPAEDDQSAADNSMSLTGTWLPLAQHLADVEIEASQLVASIEPSGIGSSQRHAVTSAARLHDIGKAHEAFQKMLRSTSDEAVSASTMPANDVLLAKSASLSKRRGVMERRYFRHELVSALVLLGEGAVALAGCVEADLAIYLVAAHHGRIRVGLRSLPDEPDGYVLGVTSCDSVPAMPLPGGELPATVIDLGVAGLGGSAAGVSWSLRALALRDRPDLGPFRLGFLEAMVRLADWRASAAPGASLLAAVGQ